MSKIRYTQEHEWLLEDDGLVTVGITNFAQAQLGDLVYIQLPEIGKAIAKGEEAAIIESVKAASEIKMPVTGVIVEVNTILNDEPGKVNERNNRGQTPINSLAISRSVGRFCPRVTI